MKPIIPAIVIITLMLCSFDFTGCSLGQHPKITHYDSGLLTSSGQPYSKDAFTCSVNWREWQDHWLRIEWNHKVIYVLANDTMKDIDDKTTSLRVDLTPAAFKMFAPLERGVITGAKVTVAE